MTSYFLRTLYVLEIPTYCSILPNYLTLTLLCTLTAHQNRVFYAGLLIIKYHLFSIVVTLLLYSKLNYALETVRNKHSTFGNRDRFIRASIIRCSDSTFCADHCIRQ